MGTWGSGNFDNDTAADYLSDVIGRLVTEVAEWTAGDPVAIEPDEYGGVVVPCTVELLNLFARSGYGAGNLPQPQVVEEWKNVYMAVWESTIDGLEPAPGHKEERRAVLNRTFDQLAEAVGVVG